ncbi:MAG: TolC family protein [Xylophilus ampelinus]
MTMPSDDRRPMADLPPRRCPRHAPIAAAAAAIAPAPAHDRAPGGRPSGPRIGAAALSRAAALAIALCAAGAAAAASPEASSAAETLAAARSVSGADAAARTQAAAAGASGASGAAEPLGATGREHAAGAAAGVGTPHPPAGAPGDAGGAAPDGLPQAVGLEAFLELVRWNSPALRAERLRLDAARADLRTASALPNPLLSASRQPGIRGERGERQLAVEQPLPIFGQRGLRMENARLGIDAARDQVAVGVAGVLREAGRSFVALQVAQERERRLREALDDLEAAARIVRGQVEAGVRSRYERTRIEVELAGMAARAEESRARTADAAARLAAAAGAPGWRPEAAGLPALPAPRPDAGALWREAQERLPELRAARSEEAQARQRIEVERREAWPVPAVGVGRLRDADGRHNIVGVSVVIPLFDRNQGPIARARAEAEARRLQRDAVALAAEAELRRAAEQFQRRRQLAARYEAEGLARVPELRRMAQDFYTLGNGGILEFIDAVQAVAERRIAWLDLVEGAMAAELDLRTAAGDFAPD